MPEIVWTVEDAPGGGSTPTGATPVSGDMVTFRDTLRKLSPPWLQRGTAEKILYSIGVHLDGLGDALFAAVKLRFPGYASDALPYIGRERRIRRGRTESDAVYASRLQRWLDDHRGRGGPYAMLAQLFAHYAPANFRIDLVYRNGRRFAMDAAGNVTRDDPWVTNVADWAKWTLYYFWPVTPSPAAAYWGDVGRTWGDGKVWGSTLTVDEVVDLRIVPREWNAAHALGEIVLLTSDVKLWGYPLTTWGAPGLTWGSNPPVKLAVE